MPSLIQRRIPQDIVPPGFKRAIKNHLTQSLPQKRKRDDSQTPEERLAKRHASSATPEPATQRPHVQEPPKAEDGRLGFDNDSFENYYEFSDPSDVDIIEGLNKRSQQANPVEKPAFPESSSPIRDSASDIPKAIARSDATLQPCASAKSLQERLTVFSSRKLALAAECMFTPYASDSVSLLVSDKNKYHHRAHRFENPSWETYAYALELIQRGFTARDFGLQCAKAPLGRDTETQRTGPTVTVDDVDLHLRDKTIYIAGKRGLMTVPDYLSFIGVPKNRKVRFNGRVPPWAKAVFAKAERRKVIYPCMPGGPGQIFAPAGGVVEVYNVQPGGWALGKLCDDDPVGWFQRKLTAPLMATLDKSDKPFAAPLENVDTSWADRIAELPDVVPVDEPIVSDEEDSAWLPDHENWIWQRAEGTAEDDKGPLVKDEKVGTEGSMIAQAIHSEQINTDEASEREKGDAIIASKLRRDEEESNAVAPTQGEALSSSLAKPVDSIISDVPEMDVVGVMHTIDEDRVAADTILIGPSVLTPPEAVAPKISLTRYELEDEVDYDDD